MLGRGGVVASPIIRKSAARRVAVDRPAVPAAAPSNGPQLAARSREPDPSQERVIGAPVDARMIVEAGPGYGKTDVACARVAHLLEQGIAPARILLLSFTRTAVREMRNRIAELARAGTDVRGVVIRTLDSFAWRLRAGETERGAAGTTLSYEQNIDAVVELLGSPSDDLRAYLDSFRYVLVDEAQDLVGERAELVVRLLNQVRPDGGWTVFCDHAQAIYGWENGDGAPVDAGFVTLLDTLQGTVERRTLEKLYRTGVKDLKKVLVTTRDIVTHPDVKDRADKIRTYLLARAPEEDCGFDDLRTLVKDCGNDARSTFVLFRHRGSAQTMSSYLAEEGIPHRLRFGGLNNPAAPWIAHIINTIRKRDFGRPEFDDAWKQVRASWLCQGWDPENAWTALRRMGAKPGTKLVDVSLVAQRLASASLPDEVCLKEIGQDGPVVGTIHGSKGREADHVITCVQPDGWENEDQDAEARVQYVGLSRARQILTVRRLQTVYWKKPLRSGRWWRAVKKGAQLQIGLQGDVDPLGSLTASDAGPVALQDALASYDGRARHLKCESARAHNWERRLILDPGGEIDAIGALSREGALHNDLWSIAGSWGGKARPPNTIYHAWWVDLTSVAMRADNPAAAKLPLPWRETRMWLSPIVVGMSTIYRPGGYNW